METLKVYMNGAFVPEHEARVSVYDHGLLYGDGVFEGIRAYDGRVFKLHEHVDRLYRSAKAIALDIPLSRADFAGVILQACRENDLRDAYVRPVAWRGSETISVPARDNKVHLAIATWVWPSYFTMEERLKGILKELRESVEDLREQAPINSFIGVVFSAF